MQRANWGFGSTGAIGLGRAARKQLNSAQSSATTSSTTFPPSLPSTRLVVSLIAVPAVFTPSMTGRFFPVITAPIILRARRPASAHAIAALLDRMHHAIYRADLIAVHIVMRSITCFMIIWCYVHMFYRKIELIVLCLIEPQSTVVPRNDFLREIASLSHISYHRAVIQVHRPYKCSKPTLVAWCDLRIIRTYPPKHFEFAYWSLVFIVSPSSYDT